MNKVILFTFMMILLGMGSCKKKETEPDYCRNNWYVDVQTELTAVVNAALAYSTDPIPSRCTTYKNALSDYIDALEPFGECSTLSASDKAEWEDSIAEARADLANACE